MVKDESKGLKVVNVAVETREQIVDENGEPVSDRELLVRTFIAVQELLKVVK